MSSRPIHCRGLIALAAGLALTSAAVRAQEQLKVYPHEVSHLPADLAAVPRDAAWFVTVQVSELWKSPSGRLLRHTPELGQMCKEFFAQFGFEAGDVERITMFGQHKDTLCVVRTVKPVNAVRVARILAPRAQPGQHKGYRYLLDEESWRGVAFLDEHTVLIGRAGEVEELLDNPPAGAGVLAAALEAPLLHDVSFGLTAHQLARLTGAKGSASVASGWNIEPDVLRLLRCHVLTGTIDFHARDTIVQARFRYAGERQARSAEQVLQGLVRKCGEAPSPAGEASSNDPPGLAVTLARFNKALFEGFSLLRTEQKDSDVRTFLRVKAPDGVVATTCMLTDSPFGVFVSTSPDTRAADIRKIGLALLEYNRKHGRLPAPASYDKDGKPLLSWRVALLPFLGEKELYRQFHLDEPWDSEHNRKLIARMPAVFRGESGDSTPTTPFQVPVGKVTAFSGKKGKRLADLKDGPGQTLLVVEAGRWVPWTKPEEFTYSNEKPLRRFGSVSPVGVLGDGQVILLPGVFQASGSPSKGFRFCEGKGVTEKDVRALFTRAGKDGTDLPALLSRCYVTAQTGQQPQPWNGPMPYAMPNPGGIQPPIQPAIYQPGVPPMAPVYPTPQPAPPMSYPPTLPGFMNQFTPMPPAVTPLPPVTPPTPKAPAQPHEEQPR